MGLELREVRFLTQKVTFPRKGFCELEADTFTISCTILYECRIFFSSVGEKLTRAEVMHANLKLGLFKRLLTSKMALFFVQVTQLSPAAQKLGTQHFRGLCLAQIASIWLRR